MAMNRIGSSVLIAILIGLAFFMFGMIFMNFLLDEVTRARNSDNLNCASPDTDGDRVNCLIIDGTIPLFIGVVLLTAGSYIAMRFIK